MRITLDYEQLTETLGRVLTTGPERLTQLAAIPDPWEPEAASTTAAAPQPQRSSAAFSLPSLDDDNEDQQPLRHWNMGDWLAQRTQEQRAPFQPWWDEILAGVTAGKWKTQKELAAQYHRPAKWITQYKRMVLSQKVMSRAAWELCFSGWKGNRGEPREKK